MPAWLMVAVDQDDARVGLGDKGVGEGHAHGAGADDQIVRLELMGHSAPFQPARLGGRPTTPSEGSSRPFWSTAERVISQAKRRDPTPLGERARMLRDRSTRRLDHVDGDEYPSDIRQGRFAAITYGEAFQPSSNAYAAVQYVACRSALRLDLGSDVHII